MTPLLAVVAVLAGALIGGGLCYLIFFTMKKNTDAVLEAERARASQDKDRAHQAEIESLRNSLSDHFETLAARILERNSGKLIESSELKLAALLNPLREKIADFQRKVEETHGQDSRERSVLKNEIEKIVQANQKISEEANNLTRALTGDSKVQGDWGEIVLDRILESSGLRPGSEYVVQAKGLGLSAEDGEKARPDIIVNLPENKHLVIDSKVTLTAYARLVATAGEADRKQFMDSIYQHVDELSEKHYHSLEKINSPDFVLMFIPIEAVFAEAMRGEPTGEVFTYAWNRRVAIVSPATLFATLRTVASLWRTERQNRNALEIAKRSGQLYDKFVGFLDDLEKIGKNLESAEKSYRDALGKLKEGPGNLITRAQNLKSLGAKTEKQIDQKYLPEETPSSAPEEP